jgi:formylmethanofuran dehydrogenase subunit E
MQTFEEDLQEAVAFHGHLCAGQILGVRMAHLGLKRLGIDDPRNHHDLLVYVEMDRCIADAIGIVAGCSVGRRKMKVIDYGKMGATFVDLSANRAVRVGSNGSVNGPAAGDDVLAFWQSIPDESLFKLEEVGMMIPVEDRPGKPVRSVPCERCGEVIRDGREVVIGGQNLCRACANGPYYQRLT